ncbi:MAG: glycosyl transferase family 2 [Paenibacillus sp.]|nr:glycosyl transferase family 2 [Paenibacillus sp.]
MKVTVVTAVYNGAEYLKASINSILTQAYRDIEYIVVNDGSTDTTRNILEQSKDSRLQVIHLPVNQGAANALNTAIRNATGEWIAIHDADDISLPQRLKEQIDYAAAHPGLVAVGSLVKSISGKKTILPQNLLNVDGFYNGCVTREELRKIRYERCPLCHGSVMFSKEAFLKAGGYDVSYKVSYDYDLWMRLFELGAIDKIQNVLYQYRVHDSSLSHSNWEVMLNEKLRSSIAAIRRQHAAVSKPRFIVFGPSEHCSNLKSRIIPASGIEVLQYLSGNKFAAISNTARLFKSRGIEGIIVLDGPHKQRVKQYMNSQGISVNHHLFVL